MKTCLNCGAQIKDQARFCPKCGADQEAEYQVEEETQPDVEDILLEDKKRKTKRNILLALVVVLILAALCGGWFLYRHFSLKKERERLYEQVKVQFIGVDENHEIPVEAEHEKKNSLDYIQSDSSFAITANPEYIDAGTIGKVTVTYTVTSHSEEFGDITKTFDQVFSVNDTESPVIQIAKNEVTVNAGEKYDFSENVQSAADSYDGELSYLENADAGSGPYYTIQTDADLNKAGIYTVNVIASDSSANRAETQFTLRVISEEKFVAIPSGCTSERKDYDKLFREMEEYGKEYTSPAYSTKDEMRVALKEFEQSKYPDHGCQVYPGLHVQDGESEQWIFYDYNPWND